MVQHVRRQRWISNRSVSIIIPASLLCMKLHKWKWSNPTNAFRVVLICLKLEHCFFPNKILGEVNKSSLTLLENIFKCELSLMFTFSNVGKLFFFGRIDRLYNLKLKLSWAGLDYRCNFSLNTAFYIKSYHKRTITFQIKTYGYYNTPRKRIKVQNIHFWCLHKRHINLCLQL